MAGPIPPYALFILSEDIKTEDINKVLQETADHNDDDFFLTVVSIEDSSSPYKCAPKRHTFLIGEGDERRQMIPDGTHPPLPESFTSSFCGKTLHECAKYISNTPDDGAWEKEYFCVLDGRSKVDGTVMLVRRFNNGAVHAFPCPTAETGRKMMTALGFDFEEKLDMYQKVTKDEGKEDWSVGIPYEYDMYDEDDE